MTDYGVTHKSGVDAWECDQMEHLNVRYYGGRFSEAEAFAFARADLPLCAPVEEELRFKREIRRGTALRIESSRHSGMSFLHRLIDDDCNICAATLDIRYEVAAMALPHFTGTGWRICGMRLLGPQHCTPLGLTRETLLGLANHAALHLGLDRHRTRDDAGHLLTGTSVVACRIRRFEVAKAQMRLVIHSRFHALGRTSVHLQHRLMSECAGLTLAEMEVTSVFFDMKSRRPCPVPEALRADVHSQETSD